MGFALTKSALNKFCIGDITNIIMEYIAPHSVERWQMDKMSDVLTDIERMATLFYKPNFKCIINQLNDHWPKRKDHQICLWFDLIDEIQLKFNIAPLTHIFDEDLNIDTSQIFT